MPEPIIATAANVSPAWLTEVLAPHIDGAAISAVTHEPVGTGQMADSSRLHLTYESAPDHAPATLVGKFPSTDPQSREAGARGGYRAEVLYYLELHDTVAIRAPRCYHGAVRDDSTEFTLLMEDLAPAAQGDQIAGCSVEQAHAAAVNLAGLAGPRWCDSTLSEIDWLGQAATDPDTIVLLEMMLNQWTGDFIERYRSRISGDHISVLEHFAPRVGDWIRYRPDIFGLTHGDYRLDNLLFATPEGGDPVATVDWQTLSLANPVRDLSYLLGNGLLPDERREAEDDLVAAYHDALLDHGVDAGYTLDACRADYRSGTFQGPLITVLGAMSVVQTERGDDMFMVMLDRSVRQILDLDALDTLSNS